MSFVSTLTRRARSVTTRLLLPAFAGLSSLPLPNSKQKRHLIILKDAQNMFAINQSKPLIVVIRECYPGRGPLLYPRNTRRINNCLAHNKVVAD